MKKLGITFVCLTCLFLMVAPVNLAISEPLVQNEEDSPQAAANYGPADWEFINYEAIYAFCDKIMTVSAFVKSLSGSLPSDVIACVNGTNHTLLPDYWSHGKNIKYGISYKKIFEKPASGMYYVKFFVKNSTAEIDSDPYSGNSTVNCTDAPYQVQGASIQYFGANRYKFSAYVNKKECNTTLSVKAAINDTFIDLVYNASMNQYILVKDFGCNATEHYDLKLIVASGSTQAVFASNSINLAPCSTVPNLSIGWIINQTLSGTNKTYNFNAQWQNWDGTAPKSLFLMVNGIRKNLTVQPWTAYYADNSYWYGYKDTLDIKYTAVYGPYSLTVENGKTYNVTLHAINSTNAEQNTTWFNNQTFWHAFKPAFVYEVLNHSLWVENSHLWMDFEVKVTYTGTDVDPAGPITMNMYYMNPALGSSSLNLNFKSGTSWTTGFVYQAKYYLTSDANPWYGDFMYLFETEAYFYLGGQTEHIYALSSNYTVNGTAGGVGQYGVKANEWNVWEDYKKTNKGCCCGTNNYTNRYLTKIERMGRMLSADYFLTNYYIYSYDYKMWVSESELYSGYNQFYDVWGLGPYNYRSIDPNNLKTMWGYKIDQWDNCKGMEVPWIVPKKTDFKKIIEYIQANVGTDVSIKLSGVFGKKMIINNTDPQIPSKISTWTIEFDSRMVLKQDVTSQDYGCWKVEWGTKWINKGKGALPKNDGSPIIDGFNWIYVLGLGIMTIGLISVIIRKKLKSL